MTHDGGVDELRVGGTADRRVGAGRGVVGWGVGFRVERARNERLGVRRLEKLDLCEISIVTFPMLAGARVSGAERVRSRGRARSGV